MPDKAVPFNSAVQTWPRLSACVFVCVCLTASFATCALVVMHYSVCSQRLTCSDAIHRLSASPPPVVTTCASCLPSTNVFTIKTLQTSFVRLCHLRVLRPDTTRKWPPMCWICYNKLQQWYIVCVYLFSLTTNIIIQPHTMYCYQNKPLNKIN